MSVMLLHLHSHYQDLTTSNRGGMRVCCQTWVFDLNSSPSNVIFLFIAVFFMLFRYRQVFLYHIPLGGRHEARNKLILDVSG